ncbi:MAG: TerB family tellurite resistance protein [Vulcanimicrobiota bacterium]
MDKLTANQQLLLATAWVDNNLAEAEANMLRQVLTHQGVAEADIEAALKTRPPSVTELVNQLPGGQPREEVMRAVLRMCFSDGILEFEEFDLIERVAGQLGLNEETLERIRGEVSGE